MTEFVLGFRFRGLSNPIPEVALIEKVKPAWQAGKFNGIGGHVEPCDESPQHAMQHEYWEETGTETDSFEWKLFGKMTRDGSVIHLLASRAVSPFEQLANPTLERTMWMPLTLLRLAPVMNNLHFFVPAAQHHLTKGAIWMDLVDHSPAPKEVSLPIAVA